MSKITRKGFLKLSKNVIAVLGLSAIAGPVIAYFYPPELEEVPSDPVPVGPEESLPPGGSAMVQFGRYPAIVIHTEEGIKAYSAVCTHFACITKWDPEMGQIVCPCHEGYFDPLDGSVISGPPPSALEQLEVLNENGTILIQVRGEV